MFRLAPVVFVSAVLVSGLAGSDLGLDPVNADTGHHNFCLTSGNESTAQWTAQAHIRARAAHVPAHLSSQVTLSSRARVSRAHWRNVGAGLFLVDYPGVVFMTHHTNSQDSSFDQAPRVPVDPTVAPRTATHWGG